MKNNPIIKILTVTIVSIVCVFFTSLIIFNIFYIKSNVNGKSMETVLYSGDKIFTNRYAHTKKGDIVVANIKNEDNWTNKEDGDYVVKTLIATEGDTVKIEQIDTFKYQLIVNNEIVATKEIFVGLNSYYFFTQYVLENFQNETRIENGAIKVLENEVFIIGENWEVSYDCFSCGPINKNSIIGKVDIVVPKSNNLFFGAIKGLFKLWF